MRISFWKGALHVTLVRISGNKAYSNESVRVSGESKSKTRLQNIGLSARSHIHTTCIHLSTAQASTSGQDRSLHQPLLLDTLWLLASMREGEVGFEADSSTVILPVSLSLPLLWSNSTWTEDPIDEPQEENNRNIMKYIPAKNCKMKKKINFHNQLQKLPAWSESLKFQGPSHNSKATEAPNLLPCVIRRHCTDTWRAGEDIHGWPDGQTRTSAWIALYDTLRYFDDFAISVACWIRISVAWWSKSQWQGHVPFSFLPSKWDWFLNSKHLMLKYNSNPRTLVRGVAIQTVSNPRCASPFFVKCSTGAHCHLLRWTTWSDVFQHPG